MNVTEGGVKGRLILFSYSWNRTTSVPILFPVAELDKAR